jgi:hypothetical protein
MPMAQQAFQYVAPNGVIVDGIPTEGMEVRAASGRHIGRFNGLVLDPAQQCVRYVVVRPSGQLARATLLPFSIVRLDVDHGEIEIDVDDREIRKFRDFSLDEVLR